jgi:adenylosuccinate synthase
MTHIVIGANFGDEGKGLLTDYLCRARGYNEVVRFNGGAQAGHTVVEGSKRHVFNTYCSGTFAGAQTRLGDFFVLNPYAAYMESMVLVDPLPLIISPKCIITTPFEVALNQEAERARGASKHGSCGMGINETVHRSIYEQARGRAPLVAADLPHKAGDEEKLQEKLAWIQKIYLPMRAYELGLSDHYTLALMANEQAINEALNVFYDTVDMFVITDDRNELAKTMYEGAQGLALDQTMGTFPYVTRSNTGLSNAIDDIIKQGYNEPITAVYCTRPYLTRHGAGPLAYEMSAAEITSGHINDTTNIPNVWQGSLRFAPLNIPELAQRIHADLGKNYMRKVTPVVALTCADQGVMVQVIVSSGKPPEKIRVDSIPALLSGWGLHVKFMSYGPSASNIIEIK